MWAEDVAKHSGIIDGRARRQHRVYVVRYVLVFLSGLLNRLRAAGIRSVLRHASHDHRHRRGYRCLSERGIDAELLADLCDGGLIELSLYCVEKPHNASRM